MNAIIAWLKAARWHPSAFHALEMWFPWISCYLAAKYGGPVWAALVAVILYYWQRKRTEMQAEVSPGNLIAVPWVGLFPWQWTPAMQLDFTIPTVLACIAAWLIKGLA